MTVVGEKSYTEVPHVAEAAVSLRALHAFSDALDAARDRASVEHALRAWAAQVLDASEVIIELDISDAKIGVAVRSSIAGSVLVMTTQESARITITCPRTFSAEPRCLSIVGRLFGGALARLVSEPSPAPRQPSPLGTSKHARQLVETVARLARSDVGVLIGGETGVGKTFVARLIHDASGRASEPLRIVNCSAIPETLIESQLFGHERGAFTGASATRIGVLESAGAGTILLDEIGELSPQSQAKLLHVLEERRFERIGSQRSIPLRARVLCATNRDLDRMVAAGEFRKDLLFRISVVRLHVPPLRERGEDLLPLAERLLAEATPSRRVVGFSAKAQELIESYSWPGNVRELRNAIEHAIALGSSPLIEPGDFPSELRSGQAPEEDPDIIRLPTALAVLERRAIDASLRATNGNRLRAAELLGVTRQTLYNKLRTPR